MGHSIIWSIQFLSATPPCSDQPKGRGGRKPLRAPTDLAQGTVIPPAWPSRIWGSQVSSVQGERGLRTYPVRALTRAAWFSSATLKQKGQGGWQPYRVPTTLPEVQAYLRPDHPEFGAAEFNAGGKRAKGLPGRSTHTRTKGESRK